MPMIFINYRTGDGEHLATILDRELSHRFGPEVSFRASKSIRPGQQFGPELLHAVRRSSVLLAVIGPGWAAHPGLRREDDWVRREIGEALACGIPVVPVLSGRRTERLNRDDLPESLTQLAENQYLRYDNQNAEADLRQIVAELTALVPDLSAAQQRQYGTDAEPGGVRNQVSGGSEGPVFQGRDFTGDIGGTVIKNSSGPIHAGKGDQHNHHHAPNFSGDGGTYVAGDNHGGVRHRFGGGRRLEDEGR
ncbi:hypothetical protein OQI_19435 [Streptomyces pharetrae CZA14]|uniref:TIR domain-containing protein n=1 Tax=Streptomyces pharetrae CZA14 TaxID=1144883 RepID=A0ABX3YIW4_9ACTN|nr:hypothetical protein OQI_19435 [Streptomyces pharetrae CZA14]